MKEKLLITSATGKTGFATTVQLLNEGYPVRIFVRSRNQKVLELEQLGAEVAIGDFSNYTQMKAALAGVARVYYCYPMMPDMPRNVQLFIQAANEMKIEAVVFMGQRIAEFADTGSLLSNDIRRAYQLLEESGLNVVYFAPGYFADNAFWLAEFALQLGVLASPFGKGRNPWISNGDMGRVIAALLKNPASYYGQRLFPTGPQSISMNEVAAIFSKVAGRKIWLVNIPDWLFLKGGLMLDKKMGFGTFAIVQAGLYNRQFRMNRFDIEPTNVVKELTGRDAEDFETITRQYFDQSPFRRRIIGSWLSSMKTFMMMPFQPLPSSSVLEQLNH